MAIDMSELIHVGFTNNYQISYAKEDEGGFYNNNDQESYIPLYMLKVHEHRAVISGANNDDDQIEMLEKIIAEKEAVIQGLNKTIAQLQADAIDMIESRRNKDIDLEIACNGKIDNLELQL